MTTRGQPHRLDKGGQIDRSKPLSFTFNGRRYHGFEGDTLASALLANGLFTIARSLKYHRPRGIVTCGIEEPNALVCVGEGEAARPNVRATELALHDGLVARSQNCWPGPNFDLGAAAGLASGILHAGFYYKTFMWPAGAWSFYEKFIRRAAGLGKPIRQLVVDPGPVDLGGQDDELVLHVDDLVEAGAEQIVVPRWLLLFRSHENPPIGRPQGNHKRC